MTTEDYPCISEEALERDHSWPRCTVMDCNGEAMHFITKGCFLCDYCYCKDQK